MKGYNYCYAEHSTLLEYYDTISFMATMVASGVGGAISGFFTGGTGAYAGSCLSSVTVSGILATLEHNMRENLKWPGENIEE